LIDIKSSLHKLINNYKINLNLKNDKLSSLNTQIINNIDIEFLINIIYGRILIIISNNQLLNNKTYLTDVTINLGKEMINKYNLDCYKKVKQFNPNITYINWKKENQELILQTYDNQLQFELGNVLINFMIDLKLIKIEVKVLAKDEKKTILVAGPILVKLIPKLNTSFSIQALPNRIPMIVPGKLYKLSDNNYLELGGYLLNGEEYTDEIILSNWELSSKSTLLERNDISDMVNKINSVAFKINENVLDFILLNNDKYGFFTRANYIHPLSLKQKLFLSEKREIESFNSRKNLELNILGLATIFSEVPCFYLPVRLDYRGRLYCVTEYLNYQGIELAKGLLQFSRGEKVYLSDDFAINYLKIFGANCFGNKLEKQSFKDRIAWVDNNLEDIVKYDNGVLLNKAENKILFLSFCLEFIKYIQALNNKDSFFESTLPIQLDASCNGFQHLTLLVDDLSLSKELNLNKSNWNESPKDFYNFIALKVKTFFDKKLKDAQTGKLVISPEDKESYKKLAKLDIYRVLIKKAVMTIPYNASASSIIAYIKENFDKQRNPNFSATVAEITNTSNISQTSGNGVGNESRGDTGKNKNFYIYKLKSDLKKTVIFTELDFQNLRKALQIVIFVDYPKLSALAEYLKDIAKVSNSLNIPIPWILPTGLVINQQYYDKKTLKVKPFVYQKNLVNITVLNKNKFNKNKQKIALMPNLVHSLDAASLCLVIVNYFKQINNINFYSIHDCFAVPCNKVNNLIGLLKIAYCIIYTDNKYLLEFDAYFKSTIIKAYGKDAVSFEDAGILEIKLEGETIILKYPSISSIIKSKIPQINLNDSNYLIH
jgi:DNA-dependent RNA polymerase